MLGLPARRSLECLHIYPSTVTVADPLVSSQIFYSRSLYTDAPRGMSVGAHSYFATSYRILVHASRTVGRSHV